ncbi:Riboflavin biosynthesis protein RibD [Planctomycetes bacterium Poly30]|uniref:Riboflavin biosynthesis protein RibD n=1 Tax=Saltatorellus ferox TaxID=2528018 RepID=A0A518ESE1_9BACT|nr:Riboflavin biosynthesis protein RibD [Planctomycetes bacterium Poly30]
MNGISQTLDPAIARSLLRELGESARAFRFEVAPNPCVGAAVLAGSKVVSRGFHRVWGGPHAEVDALRLAAESSVPQSEWDTMLVTLEPCSTTGKTPACVDAIKRSGIRRVIVGALDPDPRHRGRGLEILEEAGIEVLVDPVPSPLQDVAPHFLHWNDNERVRRPRPWTIAKWAQTLTGQLSPPEDIGGGRWISGPTSVAEVHKLRGRVDAIVTGVGTVLHDDPRLTVRPMGAPGLAVDPSNLSKGSPPPQGPARIVLDSWLRTSPTARLFEESQDGELAGPVVIVALPGADPIRRRALEAAGATVHTSRGMDRFTLDLRDLWSWLWSQGYQRVLLETGPTLLRNALDAGFVDQLRIYTGNVRGGEGESLAPWLTEAKLLERLHRESGQDAVLEAFLR